MLVKSRSIVTVASTALMAAFASVASPASAQIINSPVPTNAYIVYNGLDWAWGDPCPATGGCAPGASNLTYQSTQGWRLPNATELAMVDLVDLSDASAFANKFYGSGGNVPAGGSDPVSGAFFNNGVGGACASPYFTTVYKNCDATDANNGAWAGTVRGAAYYEGYYSEQLYVREAAPSVPEPATWAMMVLGFGLVGFGLRYRRKSVRAAIA